MPFGLTPQGFYRKRYADVLASMEARARSLFGTNVNLTERSPLGLFIRVIAWSVGLVWQAAENVYNAAFVDTAEGTSLDKVALYIGITRRPAERATGEVTFTGDNGTVISAGFRVATEDGIEFETDGDVTIAAGTATVNVTAREAGTDGNVPGATITEIINPTAGIDSVTNASAATGGLNRETDAELRARYALSVAKGGASTIDSIRASLLEVAGVRAALVVENNTNAPDTDGRPAKSFESYLLGGDPGDIANTILQTKAAGIATHGSETETVQDSAGQDHDISFTYATEISIQVDIDVEVNAEYPVDGDELVRTAIIQYIGGEDEDGSIYAGLTMGQDVVFNRIVQLAMAIPGVDNVSVTINATGDPPGTADIVIAIAEVAETIYTGVVVTQV